MRIYKGSETTLKLPIHICGTDNVNIDRVILYTTDTNQAISINDVYITDETLNVRITDKTFDLMEDGVINYIAEGETTHFERQSSYYLKTPKDYIAISLDTQDKDVTVSKNKTTTVIKPDEGYVGLDEVRVYTDISLEENKSYEFTENNTSFDIVPDEGYEGIKSGKVSVNIPISSKTVEYNWGGSYTVLPDEGYLNQVDVNINIPTIYKTVEYTDNGEYSVFAEDGEGYLNGVGVRVNVPLEYSQAHTIRRNGSYDFTPSPDYKGMEKVTVEVDVQIDSVPIVPSQISFSGSTWEEFDMEPYDWEYVYNLSGMFTDCINLKKIHNFPQIQAHHTVYGMFYNCINLEEAPYFDTSNVGDFRNFFYSCSKLTTIPQYDMSNAIDGNGMFLSCTNLTSLPQFYCPKLKTASFFHTTLNYLTDVGGWREIRCNLNLSYLPNLTPQSIINVIEGLYDFEYWAEEPDSTQGTLTLATSLSSVVTEEMMADATNKKWKIIF